MPTFILAGYQRSLHNQVKKALEQGGGQLRGWSFELAPGDKPTESVITLNQARKLQQLAQKHGGAHIFGVSTKDRQATEKEIRPYFRMRWLEVSLIGETGRGHFAPLIDALASAIEEEDFWISQVQPKGISSPLILPSIFVAKRDLQDVWRLSESYNNLGHLEAASKKLARFSREHKVRVDGYSKTPWLDESSWVWDDSGERHGTPEFPKDWKYSHRLPDGFHFDVKSQKRTSTFKDIDGRTHSIPNGYLNITAHGNVRGA